MRGTIRYLSLCSGIESASVACQHLGWSAVAFSEIEPFPCAVLKHHYPHVPNIGDMTKIDGSKYHGTVDLIVGGTPCQSFSVAGKRGGISDPRGALALAFVRLVRDVQPRWLVWENVPGVFSSNGGRDFKEFATALVQCGYHVAWRVLDAQYFGVPQRRRRVFLVGYFGDWRPAAAVLFEPHSLRGHSAPRAKKAKNIAGTIEASLARSRGAGMSPASIVPDIVGQAMSCKWAKGTSEPAGDEHHNLIATTQYGEIAATLTSRNDGSSKTSSGDTALTLTTPSPSGGGHPQCIAHSANSFGLMQVRRLTPLECERLQGFPDHYTNITYRNKPATDGPRYKVLGNSMAVPVMRWIFERIENSEVPA